MNRHTGGGIRKGKRVLVILHSGIHVVGKFQGKKSGVVRVGDSSIPTSKIRSLAIWKATA
jgi:hypothetical protein